MSNNLNPGSKPTTDNGVNSASAKAAPDTQEHQKFTNQLIRETSPYLLQHAHNPVNWFAWGDEAIEKAKKEDKPIYLSVGYSTCYWCHAMEKECFEIEEVAKILNENFVAIKVDREERPDIDEQYMLATQILTGRGGWPNSVWLTPNGRPWMAGAYFPKEQFIGILKVLADYWKNHRREIEQQADQLTQSIRLTDGIPVKSQPGTAINSRLIDKAITEYEQTFDEDFGGFNDAPKFPPHRALRILIHEYTRTNNANLLRMITRTLDSIWFGGIHDHLGGGFHRYSTDNEWLVPHFEKMLYDNAQLMRSYADGYIISGISHYRLAVEDIFRWLQREMTSPTGGFYSALDAGQFGKEGETYLWRYDEIVEALGDKNAELFGEVYNLSPDGNFRQEHTGGNLQTNILYLREPLEEIAKTRGENPERFIAQIADLRAKLLAIRNSRKQPHKDDKIVTGFNGLMIGSLGYAGLQLKEPRYTNAAIKSADFILNNLVNDNQRLFRTYRLDKAKVPGFLDDYAYLAEGFLELYAATGEKRFLNQAQHLADIMLNDFEDKELGGFFFSGQIHNNILMRSRNLSEGGNVPAACGIAASVLLELSRLTGQKDYEHSAKRTLESLSGLLWQNPRSIESALYAVALYLQRITN
jgi:uncharacterized protein